MIYLLGLFKQRIDKTTEGETKSSEEMTTDPFWGDLGQDDQEVINWMAHQAVDRNLGMPAVLLIESSKPLSFVGSQMMHVFSPFFNTFISESGRYDRIASLMEDRDNIERLLLVIEKMEEEKANKKAMDEKAAKIENSEPTEPAEKQREE